MRTLRAALLVITVVGASICLSSCEMAWPSAVAVSSQDGGRTVFIYWNGCGGLESVTLTDAEGQVVWRIVAEDHTAGTGISLLAFPVGARPEHFGTEVPF